ncbi:UNVERIFIED_CONTAM: Serine/arginine-rich splicing factor 10 [Siphonaria sp. JEL0065]|nr:Serine/arginine-rich splicing factor 10 [Siphonaria sp. JEL0065]
MSDTPTRRDSPPPVERERERDERREREPRGRDRRSDDIRSLFVRGLAAGTRAEDLTSAFETYGAVRDVYIPKDYYSGGIKGFAYIQYASQEEADKAFDKIEYLTINGRRLTVEWAQGDRKTPGQMRTKDAPRGGGGGRRRSVDRYRRDDRRDDRSRSRSRDRRRRSRSRSRSPPRRRDRSRSRDRDSRRSDDRRGDDRRDR